MIELENKIVAVGAEGGVTEKMVAGEVIFENLEILLLIRGRNFGRIIDRDDVRIFGDGAVNGGEVGVNLGDKCGTGGKEGETVFSKEDVPREKDFFRNLLVFQELVALFEGFFVARKVAGVIRVELGENVVKIVATTTRRVMD